MCRPIDLHCAKCASRSNPEHGCPSGPAKHEKTLYWTLRAGHDELLQAHAVSNRRRYDWTGIADELTALGFKAKDGGPLRAGTVRSTWNRIKADLAHEAALKAAAEAREAAKVAEAPPPVVERRPVSEVVRPAHEFTPEPAIPAWLAEPLPSLDPEPEPAEKPGGYWSKLVRAGGR